MTVTNSEELEAAVAKTVKDSSLITADFSVEWCGPCQKIGPYFELLSNNYGETVKFFSVHVDSSSEIADTYSVSSVPTFVLIKEGREVERLHGNAASANTESTIARLLKPVGTAAGSSTSGETEGTSVCAKSIGEYNKAFQREDRRLGGTSTDASVSESDAGGWLSISSWFSSKKQLSPSSDTPQTQMGVDVSWPHAPIQIRLEDATKLTVVLNLTQPVTKIREFIIASRPEYESEMFILLTAFPTKSITDEGISIENADLAHSLVTQKLA